MITNIYYRDITRTENLEAYLLDHTEGSIEEFLKYDPEAHLTVRVESVRHRSQVRKPLFNCEIILKSSRNKKVYKVTKSNENFYSAVHETVTALKKMLVKRSEIKSHHGRRQIVNEKVVA